MSLIDDWDYADVLGSEQDLGVDIMDTGLVNIAVSGQLGEDAMFALDCAYKPDHLVHMAIANDIVLMGLLDGTLIRLDLNNAQNLEKIACVNPKKATDTIHRVFLSPTGRHALVSIKNGDMYYLSAAWTKPLRLRQRGLVIESVGWHPRETAATTLPFLLGTVTGDIYECVLTPRADKEGKMDEEAMRLAFSLGGDPVTALELAIFDEPLPAGGTKFFVMTTTPTRVFQFIGGPTFQDLFANYASSPQFFELPGELDYSRLAIYNRYGIDAPPQAFAWLTDAGVYFGRLAFRNQSPGENVTADANLLTYEVTDAALRLGGAGGYGAARTPIAIEVTEFHFLLIFPDRMQAIARLSEEVVYEEPFPAGAGRVIGVAKDRVKATLWVFTEANIYEIVVTDEDRDVWRICLEKRQYEMALQYVKNPAHRDKVLTAQAEEFYANGLYDEAATSYARTAGCSFEEIALKFIHSKQRGALKVYLLQKLRYMESADATQVTIVCTWLTEIFLGNLNDYEARGTLSALAAETQEFHKFLQEWHKQLDLATTFHLMSSHGRPDEMLLYATLIHDVERVIAHHVQQCDYARAIEVIQRQPRTPSNADAVRAMFYKFSPVLLHHCPEPTVDAWIGAGDILEPRQLIPALTRCESSEGTMSTAARNEAIRFLRHVVREGNTDPAIHNYLLSLYAQLDEDDALLHFLRQEDACFDVKYALRLCTKLGKTVACVYIYAAMDMHEEAVDLALTVSLPLAREQAALPDWDPSLLRKLWVKVARHVLQESGDIPTAMSLVAEHDELKIEDVLPFFPDFTQIDDFKDQICDALRDYNEHIVGLQQEMDDATASADLIRRDMLKLKGRYGFVQPRQRCEICSFPVLTRQFYLFPCQHVFHVDCFMGEVMKTFMPAKQHMVQRLLEQCEQARRELATGVVSAADANASHRRQTIKHEYDQLRTQLDDLVAADCVFCGEIMIRTIDLPFIGEHERRELAKWQI